MLILSACTGDTPPLAADTPAAATLAATAAELELPPAMPAVDLNAFRRPGPAAGQYRLDLVEPSNLCMLAEQLFECRDGTDSISGIG